jgi:hypothetical protein
MTPTHLVLRVVLQWEIFCPKGIVPSTNLLFGNSLTNQFNWGIFIDLLDQNLEEGNLGRALHDALRALAKKISNTKSY